MRMRFRFSFFFYFMNTNLMNLWTLFQIFDSFKQISCYFSFQFCWIGSENINDIYYYLWGDLHQKWDTRLKKIIHSSILDYDCEKCFHLQRFFGDSRKIWEKKFKDEIFLSWFNLVKWKICFNQIEFHGDFLNT